MSGVAGEDCRSYGEEESLLALQAVSQRVRDGYKVLDGLVVRYLHVRLVVRQTAGVRTAEFDDLFWPRISNCSPPSNTSAMVMVRDHVMS